MGVCICTEMYNILIASGEQYRKANIMLVHIGRVSMITSVQALGLLVITQQVKTYSVHDYLSASFGFAMITQQVKTYSVHDYLSASFPSQSNNAHIWSSLK